MSAYASSRAARVQWRVLPRIAEKVYVTRAKMQPLAPAFSHAVRRSEFAPHVTRHAFQPYEAPSRRFAVRRSVRHAPFWHMRAHLRRAQKSRSFLSPARPSNTRRGHRRTPCPLMHAAHAGASHEPATSQHAASRHRVSGVVSPSPAQPSVSSLLPAVSPPCLMAPYMPRLLCRTCHLI